MLILCFAGDVFQIWSCEMSNTMIVKLLHVKVIKVRLRTYNSILAWSYCLYYHPHMISISIIIDANLSGNCWLCFINFQRHKSPQEMHTAIISWDFFTVLIPYKCTYTMWCAIMWTKTLHIPLIKKRFKELTSILHSSSIK